MSINIFKYLIFIQLVLCGTFDHAQNQKLDSLQKVLYNSSNPLEQYFILGELYEEVRIDQPRQALYLSLQMNEISNQTGYKKAHSYYLLAKSYRDLDMMDSAQVYFQEVTTNIYKSEDSIDLADAYNNLGAIQFGLGEYEAGLEFLLKSSEIARLLGDLEKATMFYGNVGAVYLMLQDFILAEKYLFIAENLAVEINEADDLAITYSRLGYLGLSKEDYDFAKKYNLKSIEIYDSLGDYSGLAIGYRNLAEVYVKKGRYKIAIEYDKKSLEYAKLEKSSENIKKAYYCLALSYEEIGDYKQAFENQKLYSDWSDTLISEQNREAIIEIKEKYNTEQTAQENEILTQQSQIKDLEISNNNEELAKSKIIIGSSIFGLALLVVLAFTLYNRNVIKQKANRQLQHANDIINEKNRDITSSLEYASKIQEALLPTKENENLFVDSFILLKPKDIVSGDFYWYSVVDGKKIMAAIDCTGHGVPGAFMSMIGNTFLHEIVNERKIITPGTILDELRKKVIKAMNHSAMEGSRKDGMDMSLCMIDEASMTMEFSGANNPIYIIQNNQLVEIKGDKKPVGYMPERPEDFINHSIKINSGDVVYLFSDGYADQFGGSKGKKFKYKQLKDLLLKNSQLEMQVQKEILIDTFNAWKGNLEQIDDVCVIGFRI